MIVMMIVTRRVRVRVSVVVSSVRWPGRGLWRTANTTQYYCLSHPLPPLPLPTLQQQQQRGGDLSMAEEEAITTTC